MGEFRKSNHKVTHTVVARSLTCGRNGGHICSAINPHYAPNSSAPCLRCCSPTATPCPSPSAEGESADWLFDYIVSFLKSPIWNVPVSTFIDEVSGVLWCTLALSSAVFYWGMCFISSARSTPTLGPTRPNAP